MHAGLSADLGSPQPETLFQRPGGVQEAQSLTAQATIPIGTMFGAVLIESTGNVGLVYEAFGLRDRPGRPCVLLLPLSHAPRSRDYAMARSRSSRCLSR